MALGKLLGLSLSIIMQPPSDYPLLGSTPLDGGSDHEDEDEEEIEEEVLGESQTSASGESET